MTSAADRPAGPAGPDHLDPLDAVAVGDSVIVPDVHRPVAAVVEGGRVVRWLTWPSAPLPERAVDEAEAWPTPDGVWVVYRSDGIDGTDGTDDERRTAVYVGPDGVGAAVDLGDRRPVDADRGGLWTADPRDASEWRGRFGPDVEDDGVPGVDDDERAELEALLAADLEWSADGPFWPEAATWTEPTDHDDEADEDEPTDVEATGDEPEDEDEDGTVVATEYQWSIGFADDDPSEDDAWAAPDVGEPGPPSPTPPTDLVRIAPDGERTTIRVDHLIEGVTLDGTTMMLRYHPTGPRSVPHEHGGWDIVYEPRAVVVDVTAGLPDSIVTDDLDSTPVADDDDDAEAAWVRSVDEREARRARWVERLDLAGVEGTRWPLHDAGAVAHARATARLTEEFEHLADPGIVWSRGVDGPRRSRSAYREVLVEVEGTWPDTEVVVSFEHTAVPFLRLRRRYRVFDDAGRPVDHGYVSVYLDEDIDTGQIPPRSRAVDGVLEI